MISASNICDLIKLVRTCEALNWGTDGDLTDVGVLWGAPITVHTFNGSGVPRYAVIPLDGETLVCIAGTTQPLQWAQQLLLSSLVPSPDTPGSVNTFYALAGHRIVFGLGPLTGTITFTGHSMGGALALYCHSHFRQTNPLSQAIVFGQPRAGNAAFAASLLDALSFWVPGDPVPMIPPALPGGYRHGGQALTLEGTAPQPGAVANWRPDPVMHYTSEYLTRLQAMDGADACAPPPAPLAGLNQQVAAAAVAATCHC
jgi:hypothetical protein